MSYTPPPPPPPGQGGNPPGEGGTPPGQGGNPPGEGGGPPGGWGYPPAGGGYPPGSGGYPQGGGGYNAPQTNQKAMWSMILGILGLVCCGLFTGVPALILGNMAQKEIAGAGGTQSGGGMAKAGVILGWVSIALSVLGLIFFFVLGGISAEMGTDTGY